MFPNPEKILSIWLSSLPPDQKAANQAKVDYMVSFATGLDERLSTIDQKIDLLLEELAKQRQQETEETQQLDAIQETGEHTAAVVENVETVVTETIEESDNG